MKRALIIAAHPDDDILGCGGILSKYKNKVSFKVIFIAEGSTCRFNSPSMPEAIDEIKIRNSYSKEALRFLGINQYLYNDLPCGRLDTIPLIEINKIIESVIGDFKPDTVFTHSNCDSNQDNVKIFNSTIISTRPGSNVKNVYAYEVLSSTEWGFNKAFSPNVFFSLSENNLKDKCRAFDYFKSEIKPFPFPRSKDGILALASVRGMQSGNKYAEAFELVRQLI